MNVNKGNIVKFSYIGKLQNGSVFSKNKENELVECIVGEGNLIKGIEEGLIGMHVSEKKEILIPPEKAYGVRDEKLIKKFPKKILSDFIEKLDEKIGEIINLQHKDGKTFSARLISVGDEDVTLDLNHPLADKMLTFELEVVEIK